MNTGTSAAKEAGNMVDLDSDPTKLIEIVEIGKQLLITRGALTTFSHRQRHREVLRDHPGHVRRHLPEPGRAERHAAGQPGVGDPVGGHLQRPGDHRADPARPAGRAVPAGQPRRSCSAATCWSTAWAASSCRSSASNSSTCSSSSFRGSRDAPTHLARPAPRRAARRCSSSPCCSAWPTRWPWSPSVGCPASTTGPTAR